MKISTRFSLISFVCLGLALLAPKAQSAPATTPKFAVLVGITEYKQPGIQDLEGCVNDVRDMRQKLISDYGFAPQNILVLANAKAKRSDIVNAIRTQLRDKAKENPSGTFLFYFSGHGSQTPDLNGDEKVNDPTDTKDETLVTYDFDLVDDDLDVLCREIRAVPHFSGALTVITDSCHSGTNTRGASRAGEPLVRSAPESAARIEASLTPISQKGDQTQAGSMVSLSACLSTQTAEDKSFPVKERSEFHGVLTYYLLQAMDAATRTTTNDQVWTQVASVLSGMYDQLPQLEGGHPGQAFLGGALKESILPVDYSLAGNTLTFSKGVEAGAVKGGFISVYNGGKPKGQLTISSSKFGQATAKVPPTLKIAPQGTVELLTPYFGSQPLTVGLGVGVGADNPVVERLRNKYDAKNQTFVRLAKAGETPGVYLMVGDHHSAFNDGTAQIGVAGEQSKQMGYYFARAAGAPPIFDVFLPVADGTDISSSDEDDLFGTLENYAAQCNVKTLSNRSGSGMTARQAVSITTSRVNGFFDNANKWHLDRNNLGLTRVDLSRDKLRIGQGLRFDFRNQTQNSLYVSVLWLSEDGSISAIRDTRGRKQFTLAPYSDDPDKNFNEDKASSLYCSIGGKVSTETIKIFVSSKPINVWYLERDPVIKRDASTPAEPPSPFDLIAGQATGTRSPQPDLDKPEFDSWDTEAMTLTIARADTVTKPAPVDVPLSKR